MSNLKRKFCVVLLFLCICSAVPNTNEGPSGSRTQHTSDRDSKPRHTDSAAQRESPAPHHSNKEESDDATAQPSVDNQQNIKRGQKEETLEMLDVQMEILEDVNKQEESHKGNQKPENDNSQVHPETYSLNEEIDTQTEYLEAHQKSEDGRSSDVNLHDKEELVDDQHKPLQSSTDSSQNTPPKPLHKTLPSTEQIVDKTEPPSADSDARETESDTIEQPLISKTVPTNPDQASPMPLATDSGVSESKSEEPLISETVSYTDQASSTPLASDSGVRESKSEGSPISETVPQASPTPLATDSGASESKSEEPLISETVPQASASESKSEEPLISETVFITEEAVDDITTPPTASGDARETESEGIEGPPMSKTVPNSDQTVDDSIAPPISSSDAKKTTGLSEGIEGPPMSKTVPNSDEAVERTKTQPQSDSDARSEIVEEPPISPPPTDGYPDSLLQELPPPINSPNPNAPTKSNLDSEAEDADAMRGGEGDDKGEAEEETLSEEDGEDDEPADDLFNEGVGLIGKSDISSKKRGYEQLLKAASSGNCKAKEKLAYGYLFGYVLERNFTRAFEIFSELAANGNPAGQQGLGFMYSTGIGINSNQAKAVLHYTFAALGGHYFAQMAMGYRALMGISVLQSCESALSYYYKAAEKVVKESSPITGGHGVAKVRLLDEEDEDSNGYDEMVQYHSVFADSGNKGTQLLLGVLYMFGMGGAERSFKMALKFFHQAAEEGLPDANCYIGKIYAEGSDEVPEDYAEAFKYFEKAASQKHPDGYSGLGMLYFYGMGVEENYKTAFEYFQKGAERGSTDAQYYLGYMHLNGYGVRRDAMNALKYFQLASHGGHLLAIYSLGELHAEGIAVKRNCNYAVELLKVIAERGKWTRTFQEAEKLYSDGDLDSALMIYLLFSELGVEVAQANAAYLLEQEEVTLVDKNETLKRALVLWNRAAIQGYSEARVKLGDYYYYGLGTSVNYEAAASQYRIASDKLSSPQAMFNLGYMYERGLGLVKDYHLAKRYYDMAAETSSEAMIPVNLALLKMNFFSYYDKYHKYLSTEEFAVAMEQIETVFGSYWDYYLITLLSGLVVMLFLWRRR